MFNNYEFSTVERDLWSLPVRMGGMGLTIPTKMSDEQYANSRTINELLIKKVYNQQKIYENIDSAVSKSKGEIKKKKRRQEIRS